MTTFGRPGYLRRAMEAGATIGDVARTPHRSEGAVRDYLSAGIRKTGARDRVAVVRTAQPQGWL